MRYQEGVLESWVAALQLVVVLFVVLPIVPVPVQVLQPESWLVTPPVPVPLLELEFFRLLLRLLPLQQHVLLQPFQVQFPQQLH